MKKRTWIYLFPPATYEVCCVKDGKINKEHRVDWSEYEKMIWCHDCQEDMIGFEGIFGGPIPWDTAKMILGEYCFHRFDLKRKCVLSPITTKRGKMYYRKDDKLTEKLVGK